MSFYTTLNFALWPDLSTPETIGTHSAIGIGVAGWLATFSSTALALYFQAADLTLISHLNVVQALSLSSSSCSDSPSACTPDGWSNSLARPEV